MKDSFWFDVHYIDLKLSVGLMDCLMREAEDVIRASQIEFSKNLFEYHVAEYDDDRPDDEYYSYKNYYSHCEDDIEKMYKETLPSLMRRSVFLTIYGLLEFNTSLFCESKIAVEKFPFKLKELNGIGMERCLLFLKK